MEDFGSNNAVINVTDLSSGSMMDGEHAGESVKKKIGHDANTGTRNTEADGHQEFGMLTEEFRSNEVSKRKEAAEDNGMGEGSADNNGEPDDEGQQQSEVTVKGEIKSELTHEGKSLVGAKGNGMLSKHHSTQSKSQKSSTSVPGRGGNSYSQIQKLRLQDSSLKGSSKTTAKGGLDTNSKQRRNTVEHPQVEGAEVKLHVSNSSVHRTANTGGARSNHTVPQPFALATGKRASAGVRPADGEAVVSTARHTSASGISSSVTKNTRVAAKPTATPSTSKPSHPGNLKFHDHSLKPFQQEELNHDEEDACSVASSTATSVRASKARPSSSVSASGFGSRCDERAEKRKEFFSKLDEKLHAKEVEKNQLQAKTKEEKEAAIKQLRKSLTFKATPMPSFYQEAAPPKVELKKIPPTRARSPKLGRRNSCVGSQSEGNPGHLCRTPRFSLDQGKTNRAVQKLTQDENADKVFAKESTPAKTIMRRSLTKLPSEKSIKTKSNESHVSAECVVSNMPETEPGIGSTEIVEATASSMSCNCFTTLNHDERLNVQECEVAQEKNEIPAFGGLNEIEAANFEDNILRESDSLIDSVEDGDPCSMALVEDLQASDDFILKISACKVPSDSVTQKTECIPADAAGIKVMSVSSYPQSSS